MLQKMNRRSKLINSLAQVKALVNAFLWRVKPDLTQERLQNSSQIGRLTPIYAV
jgi:hypothetical protein